MSDSMEKARDALAETIAKKVESADVKELETLAKAWNHLAYGPQSGDYNYSGEYHYHTHPHALADNGYSTGFGAS